MKIERIEEYDERFEKDIIDQHGAYVINDETYAFQGPGSFTWIVRLRPRF